MRRFTANSASVPPAIGRRQRLLCLGARIGAALFAGVGSTALLLAQSTSEYADFSTPGLPGRLYVPPVTAPTPEPRPLIVALHGGGGIGTDNSRHLIDFEDLLEEARRRGAFLYVPQATSAFWHAGSRPELVLAMLERATELHAIDPDRLYLTGFSMGGGGVWDLLGRYPSRFAAAVPIAAIAPGAGFGADAVAGRPIWAFHARDDRVVSVQTGRSTISAVLQAAGVAAPVYPVSSDETTFSVIEAELNLRYTEWPSGGHSIWSRVYRDADLLAWMFDQRLAPAPPRISVHPVSATVRPGETVSFMVESTSSEPVTVQWLKDGQVVPGETAPALVLDPVTREAEGWYGAVVTNAGGAASTRPARLVVASPVVGRLINLSVRGRAGSFDRPLIAGIVSSGGPQRVLLRAVGPALTRYGVEDALADPRLELFRLGGIARIAGNDNWGGSESLRAAFAAVGAFALDDGASPDAALLAEIDGATTAQVHGAAPDGGTVLVEAYTLEVQAGTRLVNVSARNRVAAGGGALIAGFVISGNTPRRVLVRAVGPGLRDFGVPEVLPDPRLSLYTRINGMDTIVAANDDWEDEANRDAAARAVPGAFALRHDSKDAMILLTLPAGAFTAVVTGADATAGEALVEVYDADG